jgi:hypothetical protein
MRVPSHRRCAGAVIAARKVNSGKKLGLKDVKDRVANTTMVRWSFVR